MTEELVYIENNEGLAGCVELAASVPSVALDMEADSFHHYYQKVCLLQMSANNHHYVIDPLAPIDLSPLLEVLRNRCIVLHGADYDLRMMHRGYGFVPERIFDTMSAARLLGHGQIGLAALVEKYFGVVLSKTRQKSDWSKRPLTRELLDYAANDTRYLLTLAEKLEAELAGRGRLDWHTQICRNLIESAVEPPDPPDPLRVWRVKGWQSLSSPKAQAVLRSLWQWREAEAQRVDLPPFKVISNEVLLAVSEHVLNSGDLSAGPRLPRNCVGGRLARMRQAIDKALLLAPAEWPEPLPPPKRQPGTSNPSLFAQLREIRDAAAVELGLEPGVLFPSASMGRLARHSPTDKAQLRELAGVQEWQADLLADKFLAAIGKNGKPKAQSRRNTP